MSHLSKLFVLGLVLSLSAQAAEGIKGVSFSGNVEGGYAATWRATPSVNDSQFTLDHANMRMDATISDKTKVVIENVMAVMPQPTSNISGRNAPLFSSASYFSGATLSGGDFLFSNTAAYIDHKWTEGIHTWIGHFQNAFGMESMGSRWDLPTGYYSAAFANTNNVNGLGWMYDVGIKAAIQNVIPGTLEVGFTDGREGNSAFATRTPAGTIRYNVEFKKGDMSLTPVVSGYFGSSKNIGFTGGAMFKMGSVFANAEFVYTSTNPLSSAVKTVLYSVYVEPGVELGMFTLAAKADMVNDSNNSDFNLGAAISHEYAGAFRVKLAYMHSGIGGKTVLGNFSHVNDLRVMFGVKF